MSTWGYEYHSSLSITLSLLSLDRDDTDEEDYERHCATRFAAELEKDRIVEIGKNAKLPRSTRKL